MTMYYLPVFENWIELSEKNMFFVEVKWFYSDFSMMEHYCSSEVYYDDQIFFKNPSAWYMDSLLR